MSAELPPLPPAVVAAIGRPIWNERKAPLERSLLARTDVPLADGAGRRIVLVTGFLAGPGSPTVLRGWLEGAGYQVVVADVGRNMVSSSAAVDRITEALEQAAPVPSVLIGHSRGGQQCRVVAKRHPEHVAGLITLGAPVRAHRPRSAVLRASVEGLRLIGRLPVGPSEDPEAEAAYERDLFAPFPVEVPWASVWSKSDGVVEWQACLDVAAASVEVACSHGGLIASVPSFTAISSLLDRSP